MKVLVTGGAGFIGSNFIRYVLMHHPNFRIINFDKLTYAGSKKNIVDLSANSNYRFIKGDICNRTDLVKLLKEADLIINFAAESSVDKSISDARDFFSTNFLGVGNILELLKIYRKKRFIHISTDEVYGSIEKGLTTETSPLRPTNPYSASKAAADLLVLSYISTHRLNAIIVRSCNNFGPYQHLEKVIPCFVNNLLDGEKIPLYGEGLNIREWLYVVDFCRALDVILHKGSAGEIYNVSSRVRKSNLDLTYSILKILNRPKKMIKFVQDRPGHDFRYAMSAQKLEKLGWRPKYEFEAALKMTVQWYQDNRFWMNKSNDR